jgi:hypothetical protein
MQAEKLVLDLSLGDCLKSNLKSIRNTIDSFGEWANFNILYFYIVTFTFGAAPNPSLRRRAGSVVEMLLEVVVFEL